MIVRRVLVLAALVFGMLFTATLYPDFQSTRTLLADFDRSVINPFLGLHMFRKLNKSERCYPFVWQKAQQKRLHAIEAKPVHPPTGTDELALAKYLDYARDHEHEPVYLEGLRRDPHNALYHYLLADLYLRQAVRGKGLQVDKQTGEFHYEYTIKNRAKLDLAMQHLAIGSHLPYTTHRNVLLKAQLAALPPVRDFADNVRQMKVIGDTLFPEFATLRHLEEANGFYLQLLLSEGKRAQAEPFLHTGERLVVQAANDNPPTLISQLTALAISVRAKKSDAVICRRFGLTREAQLIETRHQVLTGKLLEWKEHGRKKNATEVQRVIREYGGVYSAILLPVFGTQPEGLITKASLRPWRLVEDTYAEHCLAIYLGAIAFLLLSFSAVRYWRWTIAARRSGLAAIDLSLTRMEWLRILGFGLLLPLVCYLIVLAIPAISWHEHNVRYKPVLLVSVPYAVLWSLIAPVRMITRLMRQRCVAAGLLPEKRAWRERMDNSGNMLFGVVWFITAPGLLITPLFSALLTPILAKSPFLGILQVVVCLVVGLLVIALQLIPVAITRKSDVSAPLHLAKARNMITLFAVMTLFFAALVPVCRAFERHYLRADRVMSIANHGDVISFTKVEADIAIYLRQTVRDGAKKLDISWE